MKKGDPLEVCGFGCQAKSAASDIHVFQQSQPKAVAGDHIGLNLKKVKAAELQKGMIVITPGSMEMTNHFEVRICFKVILALLM